MSIEVNLETYNWLNEIGCLAGSGNQIAGPNRKVALDDQTSVLMENGLQFGRMIKALNQEQEMITGQPATSSVIDSLKDTNTPAARLYNWKMLIQALQPLGIKIDHDTKSMIIARDTAVISEIIDEVYAVHHQNLQKLSNENQARASDSFRIQKNALQDGQLGKLEVKSQQRGKKAPGQKRTGALDITSLDTDKTASETESCLEFLLNTLCRNIDLKPKQAAGLLTSGNKYLAHILIKGVKGVFDPVIQWYQDVYQNEGHLIDLIALEENQGSVTMILGALRPGLLSKNGDVCMWAARIMSKLAYDFSDRNLSSPAWEWFISENGGVDAALMCFQRHTEIKDSLVNVFIQFGRYNFMELFTLQLKGQLPNPAEYLAVMHEFLEPITESRTSKDEIINSGILDYWGDLAMKQAEVEMRGGASEAKLIAMHFICDLWIKFPEVFEEREDITTSIQAILKKATRDKMKSVKAHALSLMFKMLDFFAGERNPYAPVFYKILTFCLVESHGDISIREMMMSNFTYTFEALPTIPVGIMVEPLIKQIQVSEGVTYFYQVFDFDFFVTLARHPRLTIKNAIQLLDLLAKIYLNDVVYARPASIPFVLIIQRHCENETIQDFVQKYAKISLAMFMSLEKKKKPKAVNLPKYNNRPVVVGGKMSEVEKESEHLSLQKRGLIVEMIKKVILCRSETLDEKLRPLIINTNYQLKQTQGKDHKGMLMLMSLWGENPKEQIKFYELEYAEVLNLKDMIPLKQLTDGRDGEMQSAHAHRRSVEGRELALRDSMDSQMSDRSAISEKMEVAKYENKSRKYLPLQSSISKKKVPAAHQRVLEDIERIKRKKEQKMEYEKQKEADFKKKDDRAKRSLKNQLEKRKLELGVAPRNKKDIENNLVFKEGAIDSYKKKEKHTQDLHLLDLDDEEEKDQESVNLLMKKFQRALKLLFNMYCNSGFDVNRKMNTFDGLAHGYKCIKLPELLKMLRDHDVVPTLITREDLTNLMRLVNLKQGKTTELTILPYKGFEEFFLQMSIYAFSKPPKDLNHLPPASSIQAMIDHFAEATKAKGKSATVYEDPDQLSMLGDKDLINELNKKLAEDPKYPLPEGYKKHEDKQIVLKYELPSFPGVDTKYKDCMEVMDSILSDALGVHIIEPLSEYKTVLKARPLIIKPKLEPQFLNYDPHKPKKLAAIKERAPSSDKSSKAAPRKKIFSEVKPKLQPGMKLLVANFGKPERMHVQEVAEVFEELLQAVERGKDSIGERHRLGPGHIFNKALEDKLSNQLQEKKQKEENDKKRKMRKQVVTKKMEKIQKQQQEEEEEKKKAEKEKKQKEVDKKKKVSEKSKKEQEERVKKIKDFKDERLKKVEEEKTKTEEEEAKKAEEAKKERGAFLKKQRTLHTKKMKEMSEKNEEQIIEEILVQVKEEEKRGAKTKTDAQLKEQIRRTLIDNEKGKYIAKANRLKSQQTLAPQKTGKNLQKDIDKAKKEEKDDEGDDGAELKTQKTNAIGRDATNLTTEIDYDGIDDPKLDQRTEKVFEAVKKELEKFEKDKKKKEKKMKEEVERSKKEKERNQEVVDLFKTKEFSDIFKSYNKNLNRVFKYYCKNSNQATGFDLNKLLNNLQLKEYVKFGTQFNITPAILTMDDMIYTFRILTKEREKRDREKGKEPMAALEFEDFEEALFRIAVTGQKVLGGVKESEKKADAERGQYTNLTADYVVSATTPETLTALLKFIGITEEGAALDQKLSMLNDKSQKSNNPREKKKERERLQKDNNDDTVSADASKKSDGDDDKNDKKEESKKEEAKDDGKNSDDEDDKK